jgi:hypothetical protein
MKVSRLEAIRDPTKRVFTKQENVDSNLPDDNKTKATTMAPLEVIMPEIPPAYSYLRELFYSSGQVRETGQGIAALTYAEIGEWRKELELDLFVWEREVIYHMSRNYINEYYAASDPARPAPYMEEIEPEQEDKIAKALAIREQLRAFGRKQQG